MSRIRVFMCTKNQKYSERIVRYATARTHPDIQFQLLTEIRDQTEFRENDVVVSDDYKKLNQLECHRILMVRQREEENEEQIFMYQDRESIYQSLMKKIGIHGEVEIPKVMCVFSPEGGDEKTRLALQYAMEYGKTKKVLYISLCGFPVFFRREVSLTPEGIWQGVSELFLCTSQKEFDDRLKEISFSMGRIDMVSPVEYYKDLLDFSRKEVNQFTQYVKQQELYDVVIVEMGQLFEYSFDLMCCAQRVLVPKEPGFLAEVRRHVFREYCRREGKEEILDRMELVPVSFPQLENLDEVNRIFFGEEGEDGSGGTSSKGKNTKPCIGANIIRGGT